MIGRKLNEKVRTGITLISGLTGFCCSGLTEQNHLNRDLADSEITLMSVSARSFADAINHIKLISQIA